MSPTSQTRIHTQKNVPIQLQYLKESARVHDCTLSPPELHTSNMPQRVTNTHPNLNPKPQPSESLMPKSLGARDNAYGALCVTHVHQKRQALGLSGHR